MYLSIFLSAFVASAQSRQVGIKPKFVERLPDSVEIIETRWVADSVEYSGDSQCPHAWVNGDMFWHNDRNLAAGDSLKLSMIPPRHVLPRICSNCLRKEYLIEHITKQKAESEYARLRQQMLLKKQ